MTGPDEGPSGAKGAEPAGRDAAGPEPGREPGSPRQADHGEIHYCDLCGAVMLNLHCKLVCERCGYKRDCSDP